MNEKSSDAGVDPVLLFDGECGLCQRVVRFLLRLDRCGALRFAPLQGPSAQEFLREHGMSTQDFSSVIFVPDWTASTGGGKAGRNQADFLTHTDAAIAALRACGRNGLAGVLRLFPRSLRDAGYRWVGHARYRIFGPWRPHPLPRREWEARFLA